MRYLERITQSIFDPELFIGASDEEGQRKLYTDFIRKHLVSYKENLAIHGALDQAISVSEVVRKCNSKIIRMTLKKVAEDLMNRGLYKEIPPYMLSRDLS